MQYLYCFGSMWTRSVINLNVPVGLYLIICTYIAQVYALYTSHAPYYTDISLNTCTLDYFAVVDS